MMMKKKKKKKKGKMICVLYQNHTRKRIDGQT